MKERTKTKTDVFRKNGSCLVSVVYHQFLVPSNELKRKQTI